MCVYVCMSVWVVKDTDRDTLTGASSCSAHTESTLYTATCIPWLGIQLT